MDHRIPTERSFGLSVGGALLLFGGIAWWRDRESISIALGSVGAALAAGGLLAPALLRVPNRVWWRFAQALGWVNARVILSAFFFMVLTPAGFIMRLAGRNPLRPPQGPTNWSKYAERRRDPSHYERMF